MPTENLRLAIEIADAVDRAAESGRFDAAAEARRIAAEHPHAPVGEDEIAKVLEEEADRQTPGGGA